MTTLRTCSDDELVCQYCEGCDRAFAELLRRYETDIHNYIFLTIADSDVADDLFQEVFIKVMRTLKEGKYHAKGKFKAWLLRLTHNMMMDHFRREKRTLYVTNYDANQQILDLTPASELPEDFFDDQEALYHQISLCVEDLPEAQREVLKMRIYEDIPFKEIAERTEVSISTALGRMRYALINLRKMVQKRNIAPV